MSDDGQIPYEVQQAISVNCHALIDGIVPSYGYVPSVAANAVFAALFFISGAAHTWATVKGRRWWYICFTIGCIGEIIGYGGRLWASQCPYESNAFMIQISTLIFSPAFFTAGIYYILKQFIDIVGREYSLLPPNLYLWIFIGIDVLSLALQGAGGGMAASAADTEGGDPQLGTNIMVSGVIFQMVAITIFVILFALFLWKSRNADRPKAIMLLTYATVLSCCALYVRSIYRTMELLEGWGGHLLTTEHYFYALDSAMMVVCVGAYNIIHPALVLPSSREVRSSGSSTSDEEKARRGQVEQQQL